MINIIKLLRTQISIPLSYYIIIGGIIIYLTIRNIFISGNTIEQPIQPVHNQICILDNKTKTIKTNSNEFFALLNLEQINFWNIFVKKYNINISTFESNKNYTVFSETEELHINMLLNDNQEIIIYAWKCKDVFDLLPIPMKIQDNENLCFKLLTNKQDIQLPIDGNFIKQDDMIFKLYEHKLQNNNICYYSPLMKIKELKNLCLKYPEISMSYLVCNRDGKILHFSKGLENLFNCSNEIFFRINDFYNFLRGKFIPDNTEFNNIKNRILHIIKLTHKETSEIITTMNNLTILIRYYAENDQIWIIYDDISKYTKNTRFYDDFQSIANKLTDIILCFSEDNKLIWTNSELCKTLNYIQAKILLQNLGIIEEIKLDNKKFIVMSYNINKRLESINEQIDKNSNIMERLFDHLSEKYSDTTLVEYGKYTKFLFLNCHSALNSIINIQNKSIFIEKIDIVSFFDQTLEKIQKIFVIKNIEYKIESLEIKSNTTYLNNILECMLQLAFNYQFDSKKFIINRLDQSTINIILCSIPNLKTSEIFNTLSIFNGYYGQCYIDNIKNGQLNIGFHVKDYD